MTSHIEGQVQALEAPSAQGRLSRFARKNGLQIGIILVFLAMWGFLVAAAPLTFLSREIYGALMANVSLYGVIALPLTLCIVAKEIDLSFPSIMAVAVAAYLAVYQVTSSVLLSLMVCLAVGFLVGLLNGIIIVKLGIPSLIATIGTQFFWRGFVLVVTNARGGSLVEAKGTVVEQLLVGRLNEFWPAQMIWMVIVGLVMWLLLNRHRFGAHVYLIGDNENSARLMGVNADRTRMLIFALVGLFAAFAGILSSLEVSYYWPTLGEGYLLKTLAAVFLGGTAVAGGTGTILGSFLGCFIIGAIESGTVAINLTGFWTQLIYGLIIVLSVAMYQLLRRRLK